MTEEGIRRPVFIFLDENNSSAGPGVQKYLLGRYKEKLTKFDLNFCKFPKEKKGKKDWVVTLYLKEKITSSRGKIAQALSRRRQPIFIFLTLDTYFTRDALDGFNRFDKDWVWHEKEMRIFLESKLIRFKMKTGEWVVLKILPVSHKDTDSQEKIDIKMGETLISFLSLF